MPAPRLDPTASVNAVIARHPETVAVFNAFGIDACCGGDAAVPEAARRDGADPAALVAALEDALAATVAPAARGGA